MLLNGIKNIWDVQSLTDHFEIITGTTPSTKNSSFWDEGEIVWITPTDLSAKGNNIFIFDSERKITHEALNKTNLTLLPENSLILSTRAPVGYVAINTIPITFNQGCKALVAKDRNKTLSNFYYYYFLHIKEYLQSISGGSTFKELSKDSLKNLSVPVPKDVEQKAIAEILTTVDEAIQKADEAIKKTERIKQGVMQKLLTEGIGHTEFKNTKVGRIPKEWAVKKLSEIADFKNGINFSKQQKGTKGILTIDVLNMYGDSLYLDMGNLYRVNKKIDDNSDYLVNNGDLLFVRSSLKREGAGWVSLFNGYKEKVTFCGFIIKARISHVELLPEFATYYLRSPVARRKILANAGQVAITNISQENLSSVFIAIPNKDEQIEIISILKEFDNRYYQAKERKQRLERIKQGLMNDLLTGKKRVQITA